MTYKDSVSLIKGFDFDSAAFFRINVKGVVREELMDLLGSMKIRHSGNDDVSITQLEGKVLDQAALMGILNTLYEMRYPIINIELILPRELNTEDN